MTELLDVTGDVTTFYFRFNDTYDLTRAVDELSPGTRMRDIVYPAYDEWFAGAGERERAFCLSGAIDAGFARRAGEKLHHMTSEMVSDVLSENSNPHLPAVQERWLATSTSYQHFLKISLALADRVVATDRALIEAALADPTGFCETLPTVHIEREELDFYLNYLAERDASLEKEKKSKKVLKRGARLMSSFLGTEKTRLFIQGDAVEISGRRFTFRAVRRGLLRSDGHGGLGLSVHDRDGFLADLCWYVEGTPVIDQIVALVLAVQSGEENDVIETGNVMKLADRAPLAYPDVFPHRPVRCTLNDIVLDEDRMFGYTEGTTQFLTKEPSLHDDFYRRAIQPLWKGEHPMRGFLLPHHPAALSA